MHEGTVCREILDIAIEAAHNNDISKITAITMVYMTMNYNFTSMWQGKVQLHRKLY